MLTIKTKKELSQLSDDLARGLGLVSYRGVLYVPADYETLDVMVPPAEDRRVWLPLTPQQVARLGNTVQNILFTTEAEMRSYLLLVSQNATVHTERSTSVLIATPQGLRELREDGQLHEPTTEFRPHFIKTQINDDAQAKAEVLGVLEQWLGSEEDVTSLLHHLATVLAPHWSAVRYVLLIGEGRNGKSLLMKMLVDLLGQENVSHVTRQDMSNKSSVCHDLTNKLLNVVFDGEATYLKDSGLEKTLTAGEVGSIRKLYETHPTPVQTNGLFIEGLNREPKTSDKSMALQKRIVRFYLPNVFELDHAFEQRMRSPEILGALLALLVEHYVTHSELSTKLRLTARSLELKIEQMHVNNHVLQYLEYVDNEDPLGVDGLLGENMEDVAARFQSWRLSTGDVSVWSVADVVQMMRPLFITNRKSLRVNGRVRKVRVIEAFKPDTIEFLSYIRGEEDDTHGADSGSVVADGAVHEPEPAATGSAD